MAQDGDDKNTPKNNGGTKESHISVFQARSTGNGDIRYRKLVDAFWLNAGRDIQMVLTLRAYQKSDPNAVDHHQFARRLSVFRHFQERCAAPIEPAMDVVLLLAASADSSAVDSIFNAQENLLEQLRIEPHDSDFKSVCLALLPMNTASAVDALLDHWLKKADNIAVLDRLDPRYAGEEVAAIMRHEGLVDMSFFRHKYSSLTGAPAPQENQDATAESGAQNGAKNGSQCEAKSGADSAKDSAKIIPFRPRPKR